MGTNYYAVKKKPSLYNGALHIGKSSCGWKFCFQGYEDELNIKSIEDWKKYLKSDDIVILNEYDEEVSYNDFFKLVEEKQKENNPDDFKYSINVNNYRFTFRVFG